MTQKKAEPKFTSSLKWQSVNVTVQVILQLAFIAALARLISPDAFGVMAIALVVVGLIEIFAQVGIGPALIQNKSIEPRHRQTAFIFSLLLGIVFFIGTWFAAPAIAEFYDSPLLTDVLRWISLSFIISGASVVPRSMLIKEMRFKSLFFCSATAMILGNLVIGLGLALNGFEIWAYVAALLAQNTLLGIGYWISYPGPIGLKMDKGALKEMVGYGSRSTMFNMLNYASGKMDTLIVGRFSGNWTLTGFYDRSSYLMGLPVTVLGKLGDSVLFSGLSMLQADTERLRKTVLQASYAILTLVIPLTLLLSTRAENFTVLLLGTQYIEATATVSILFLAVGLRSFIKIGDASMRATDRLKTGSLIKLGFFMILSYGVYYTMKDSPDEYDKLIYPALAVVFATAVQAIAVAVWLIADLKVGAKNLLKTFIPGVVLSVPVMLVNWKIGDGLVDDIWPQVEGFAELNHLMVIAIHITIALVFALFIVLLRPELLDGGMPEMRRKIFSKLPSTPVTKKLTR